MCGIYSLPEKCRPNCWGRKNEKKKKKENFVGCVVLERKALTQKQKQSKIKKKKKSRVTFSDN